MTERGGVQRKRRRKKANVFRPVTLHPRISGECGMFSVESWRYEYPRWQEVYVAVKSDGGRWVQFSVKVPR